MIKILCLAAAMSITLGCMRESPPQRKETWTIDSDLLRLVVGELEDSGRSGSLVYQGDCTPSGGITDSFKVNAAERGTSPVQAMRRAFSSAPRLTVKEDASGVIRVTGGDIKTDLLDLRIHEIIFHDEADPREAAGKILALPEVKAYMGAHHMRFISVVNGLIPMSKGVHLTASLKGAVLSQSLDRIAQAFPGVWIYEECATTKGERLVYFSFHEFSSPNK